MPPVAEPTGPTQEGRVEGGDPPGVDLDHDAVVDGFGGVHRDPGMTVLVIVIPEELRAEDAGVLGRTESHGKRQAVFQRLGLRLCALSELLHFMRHLQGCGRTINITVPDLDRFFCVGKNSRTEVSMSLPEPLRASAQHIELLQDKRRRLSDALVSAELQFLAALRRECLDGEMTWTQLRDAYRLLSAGRLTGLRARWIDAISVSPEDVILSAKQEAAGRADGVSTAPRRTRSRPGSYAGTRPP